MKNLKYLKIKKILLSALLSAFLILGVNFVPAFAFEVNYPSLPPWIKEVIIPPQYLTNLPTGQLLVYYFRYIFGLIVGAAFLIFLIGLSYTGVLYLTSRGKPEKLVSARERMTALFFGFLILISSYALLNTINPQLVSLEIPEKKPPEISETIPFPIYTATGDYESLISVGLPIGTIMEKILDINYYKSNPYSEEEKETLGNNPPLKKALAESENILKIAENLKKNSQALKELSEKCSCSKATPRCGENCQPIPNNLLPTENIFEEDLKIINEYNKGSSCQGDPCIEVRKKIIALKKENEEQIEKLKRELVNQKKIITFLKKEMGKFEVTETFMKNCPLSALDSLADSASAKNFFRKRKGYYGEFDIWENIKIKQNWAGFYCSVSGNILSILRTQTQALPDEVVAPESMDEMGAIDKETGEQKKEKVDIKKGETLKQHDSCEQTIPLGEVMDRAKRLTNKVIERLESIFILSQELIKNVDKMQILISKCTSQAPMCNTKCEKYGEDCQASCEGNPCPSSKIAAVLSEIQKLVEKKEGSKEGIKDVIDSPLKNEQEKREEIGLKQIVQEIVPDLIKDLDTEIKRPILNCSAEIAFTSGNIEEEPEGKSGLLSCEMAKDSKGETGIIKECCLDESSYQECLKYCYLERKYPEALRLSPELFFFNDYKKCLKTCLEEQSKKIKSEAIKDCHHKLNFFCCTSE